MNDHEREICARVRIIREVLQWSRPSLADRLCLTADTLISIEYGRTPLRYVVAWRLREGFGVSLRWLETGFGDVDDSENDNLPPPTDIGFPANERALLTEVAKAFPHARSGLVSQAKPPPPVTSLAAHLEALEAGSEAATGKIDVTHRAMHERRLKMAVGEWVARVPLGRMRDLSTTLSQAAEQFLRSIPPEPLGMSDIRADELMWERLRETIARQNISAGKKNKEGLTHFTLKSKSERMHSELQVLVKRLKQATAPAGMKGKLARRLGVSRARVSEWLHGKKEPGGETTLKLLHWVEQHERQQKTPGSAINTAKGKLTQRRKASSHANQSKKDHAKP